MERGQPSPVPLTAAALAACDREREQVEARCDKAAQELATMNTADMVDAIRNGMDEAQQALRAARVELGLLRARLLNRINLCACHYGTQPENCATCLADLTALQGPAATVSSAYPRPVAAGTLEVSRGRG